jgi:DNA-binding NtrC family response regulator
MTARQLDLVSFVSHRHGDSLLVALRNLGYEPLPARWDTWLQAHTGDPSKPTVLFVTGGNYPREQVVSVLEKTPRRRVLGVFSCNDSNWDEDLLRCCVDFVGWPCRHAELALRLRRAFGGGQAPSADLDETVLLDEFVSLNMLGKSPAFVDALKLIKRFARCDAPVLLEGETGTGKEVAARAIHYLSARRDGPFIPVNCGAIPHNLLENELFGHEKGAFTDAKESQPGLVVQADGGTLFLDEVDALSPGGQVALLRFIEEQRFRPLGGRNFREVDVRIIAAANGDLRKLADDGMFRRDLLFRLNVLGVWLPPLRERGDDIVLLADAFLSRYSILYKVPEKHLHPDTFSTLLSFDWPGNVRELENTMHRAFLLAEGPVVSVPGGGHAQGRDNNPRDHGQDPYYGLTFQEAKARIVSDFEKRYLCRLMSEAGGNISRAAECSGKERSALSKLLKKHNIRRKQYHTDR